MNFHGIIEKYKSKNHKMLLIIFAVLFIFGIIHGTLIFPSLLRIILKMLVQLKPGNELRGYWETLPFYLGFKIYLFNITNPDEVTKGGKPIIQEIGPYYFEEWKSKHEIIDDKDEDTATFYARDLFIFRPDLSDGLTGNETVVMLDPMIVSIAINVIRDRPAMIDLVSSAMEFIYVNKTDPFFRGRAMDILFDGYPIDCSSHEFPAKAVCIALETEAETLGKYNETHFKFSLFGAANMSDRNKMTVFRGMKNLNDLGRVIRFRDEEEWEIWDTDECNEFRGSDGTVFPPLQPRKNGIWAFVPVVCRGLNTVYERKSSYAGLSAERYILKIGDAKNDESLHCYCRDPPEVCPPKGVMDLSPCFNAPFTASLPHFYDADPELLDKVDGLSPNKAQHGVEVDFERTSGTPLRARNRLQFNIDLMPVKEVIMLKEVPDLIFPLFWVEETLDLNKTFTNKLKYQLFIPRKLSNIFKWSCLLVGIIGMITSGMILYLNSKESSIEVTKVSSHPKSAESTAPTSENVTTENGVSANANGGRTSKVHTILHGYNGNLNGTTENAGGVGAKY